MFMKSNKLGVFTHTPSSSCHDECMDSLVSLSSSIPIVHFSWQVLYMASSLHSEVFAGLWNSRGEKSLCMIFTELSEFVSAKLNLNSTFIQVFIGFYWLKIIYIVDIMQYLKQMHGHSHKNATRFQQK